MPSGVMALLNSSLVLIAGLDFLFLICSASNAAGGPVDCFRIKLIHHDHYYTAANAVQLEYPLFVVPKFLW